MILGMQVDEFIKELVIIAGFISAVIIPIWRMSNKFNSNSSDISELIDKVDILSTKIDKFDNLDATVKELKFELNKQKELSKCLYITLNILCEAYLKSSNTEDDVEYYKKLNESKEALNKFIINNL